MRGPGGRGAAVAEHAGQGGAGDQRAVHDRVGLQVLAVGVAAGPVGGGRHVEKAVGVDLGDAVPDGLAVRLVDPADPVGVAAELDVAGDADEGPQVVGVGVADEVDGGAGVRQRAGGGVLVVEERLEGVAHRHQVAERDVVGQHGDAQVAGPHRAVPLGAVHQHGGPDLADLGGVVPAEVGRAPDPALAGGDDVGLHGVGARVPDPVEQVVVAVEVVGVRRQVGGVGREGDLHRHVGEVHGAGRLVDHRQVAESAAQLGRGIGGGRGSGARHGGVGLRAQLSRGGDGVAHGRLVVGAAVGRVVVLRADVGGQFGVGQAEHLVRFRAGRDAQR